MKKNSRTLITVICLLLLAMALPWAIELPMSPVPSSMIESRLTTDRVIPNDADVGSYLAGLFARKDQDLKAAADYYADVLARDPNNNRLRQELYLLRALQGDFADIMPLVQQMAADAPPVYLAEYVLAVEAIRQEQYDKARQILKDKAPHALDVILLPLVHAWIYAGQGRSQDAYDALALLKDEESFLQFYWYHYALIGLFFGDDSAVLGGLARLAELDIPAISYFPRLRQFYVDRNLWQATTPLFVKYQVLVAKAPATVELMNGDSLSEGLTISMGVAEAFYNVSTSLGGAQKAEEGALLLNGIALYVNPKAVMPKIWAAELFEVAGSYQLAERYYAESPQTVTIRTKRAQNFLRMGQPESAIPLLEDVLRLVPKNPVLLGMLAQAYRDTRDWQMAIDIYSREIDLLPPDAATVLADAYFARADAYARADEPVKAESDLIKAQALNPEDPMVLNYLGYVWLEQGKELDRAIDYIQKAYEAMPGEPNIMDSLAFGYFLRGDYMMALPLAERAVDLIPHSAIANAHLGYIYEAVGRAREAGYQYQKALDLGSDLTPGLKKRIKTRQKALESRN